MRIGEIVPRRAPSDWNDRHVDITIVSGAGSAQRWADGEHAWRVDTQGRPNISPPAQEYDVEFHYESDFFHADEVVKIEAVDTGALLFDLSVA
jgi:hypothetical protein